MKTVLTLRRSSALSSLNRELQNVMAAEYLYFFSASRFSTLFTIACKKKYKSAHYLSTYCTLTFTMVWEGILLTVLPKMVPISFSKSS